MANSITDEQQPLHRPVKILLVCYNFPPNSGIGGRRWAKLAKGLALEGCEIFVIKSDAARNEVNSTWKTDISLDSIKTYSVKRGYPAVLSHGPRGVAEKVLYKFHLYRLKFSERGTLYDNAIGWQSDFLTTASSIIEKEGITKVIVTGPPFNAMYYTALLKKRFPDLTLLCDYRDPWLNASNNGMAELSDKRRAHEHMKHALVTEMADVITAPNTFLLNDIRAKTFVKPEPRFAELPHFFDPDDITPHIIESPVRENNLNLLYAGSLYDELTPYLTDLSQMIQSICRRNETISKKISIDFYTSRLEFASIFKPAGDIVTFHQDIGKQIFAKINEADALFIFLSDRTKNYLTTKFFEYLPFRKPLFFIGAEGYASSFIEKHQLGYVVREESQLESLLEKLAQGELPPPAAINLDNFSLSARTKTLLDLLS